MPEEDETEGMEDILMKSCANCKHKEIPGYYYPCCRCDTYSEYEAMEKAVETRTNGDRIRAKNDEELARWMIRYQLQIIKETLRTLGTEEHVKIFEEAVGENPDCTDIVRWLQQPAEEVKK